MWSWMPSGVLVRYHADGWGGILALTLDRSELIILVAEPCSNLGLGRGWIISEKGFEIPVISVQMRYKISFIHGEKVLLKSQFKLENKIRLNCKTLFLKSNGAIGAEAIIGLVVVRNINDSIKLV